MPNQNHYIYNFFILLKWGFTRHQEVLYTHKVALYEHKEALYEHKEGLYEKSHHISTK